MCFLVWVLLALFVKADESVYVFQFMDDVLPCTERNARYLLTQAGLLDVEIYSCNFVLRYCKGFWNEASRGDSSSVQLSSPEKSVSAVRVLSGGEAHINEYGELAAFGQLAVVGSSFASTVNDPLYFRQWGLHSYDVQRAWDIAPNCDAKTLIVSIDTGADLEHLDLQHVSSEYECNSLHPMFHDGCDHKDSVASKHGTGVASIIAARKSDGYGMAGVSNCRMLPIKLSNDGTFGSYEFASAVTYAVSIGASVITTSIVWSTPTADMVAAVKWAHSKGVPIVTAGGNCNFGSCMITYPAGIPETLAVGAVDKTDQIPDWQSQLSPVYGPHRSLDLFAPGVDVLVAFKVGPDDSHKLESGSSFAAPFVAGLIAQGIRAGVSAMALVNIVKQNTQTGQAAKRFSPCRALRAAYNCSRLSCPCSFDNGVESLPVPQSPSIVRTNTWLMISIGLTVFVIGAVLVIAKVNM